MSQAGTQGPYRFSDEVAPLPPPLRRPWYRDPFRIAPLVMLPVGIGMGIAGFVECGEALDGLARFEHTTGQVVRSDLHTTRGGRRGRVRKFVAQIDFRYDVGGREYLGARIDWEHPRVRPPYDGRHRIYRDLPPAQQQLATYPVGAWVDVYYDPRDPGASVVDPGVRAGSVFKFLLGSATFVAGMLLAMFAWGAPRAAADPGRPG